VSALKAYRDLEREGLVEARSGHGTFVHSRPPGPPPGTHSRLGRARADQALPFLALAAALIAVTFLVALRRDA
jgi:DNA-binding GntR family transcriptional regulator